MTFGLGIVSALTAPLLVVVGFIIWDNHWTGSAFALNMYKCNLTGIGFAIVSLIISYCSGSDFRSDVFTFYKVGALIVSSTIGILIGDWTWIEGMRLLGARKIIVMDTLKPFLAALLGRIFLGEHLNAGSFMGLILTAAGVSLVAMEQSQEVVAAHPQIIDEDMIAQESDHLILNLPTSGKKAKRADSYAENRKKRNQSKGEAIYGFFMAAMNVILHTFGALLTKKFGVGMTTFEINLIRFGFAGVTMAMLSAFLSVTLVNQPPSTEELWFRLPKASQSTWVRISVGVVFVSFLQPALTNYAMFQISLALLLTLESIGPIYSLPLSYLLQGDRPTFNASIGAILAVVGIVILSFGAVTRH